MTGLAPATRPESDPRTSRAPHLPRELYLEVTNRCNLECRTCPQHFGMAEPAADLDPERVAGIIGQLPRLERVVLHGIGEPLLNRELPAIVRLVKQRGAYALLNSNGTLLKGARCAALVETGIDEIRVSLDAATAATYAKVRGAESFDLIVANLRRLARETRDRSPRLSLWMTGLRESLNELEDLVRLAADVGIDEVYLQRLVTSERGLACREESLYGDGQVLGRVAAAEALARELGVRFMGSGAAGAAHSIAGAAKRAPWRGCRRPWRLMYVTAGGNVLSCCIAPFTAVPYGELILGNLFEQTVEQVWEGELYRAWRAALLAGRPPAPCAGCGVGWSL